MSAGTPGGLADCSVDYNGNMWYNFDKDNNSIDNTGEPPDWENHAGYITGCWGKESTACQKGDKHTLVGNMEHTNNDGRSVSGSDPTDLAFKQTTFNADKICPITSGINRCTLGQTRYICQKNEDVYTEDWQECCKNNPKWSPKNNCNPYWYNDNGEISEDCTQLCMGNESYSRVGNLEETLKNGYENGLCLDSLKNQEAHTLRDICKEPPFYVDGKPNEEYNNICGCFYPDEYYDDLKDYLRERFGSMPESSWSDKTCYSTACANSELKHIISTEQCPDVNFMECINNLNFNASSISGDGSIIIDQKNECNIYSEEYLDTISYCGKECETSEDCPGSCPCSDNVCKNEDSVSCTNYSCSSNMEKIPNSLCSGDESTCDDDSCCYVVPEPTPDDPDDDPDDEPEEPSKTNWVMIGLIIGGIVLVLLIISISIGFTRSSGTNRPVAYIQG